MKKLGILVLILGLIGIVLSIQMDTSVASYGGARINNLGITIHRLTQCNLLPHPRILHHSLLSLSGTPIL